MTSPVIILHRRNRLDQLAGLPAGCWIEVDIDLHGGVPCVSHDPIVTAKPLRLDEFLLEAIRHGAAGFVFDCKREGATKAVQPLIARYNVVNYFYLNEMEIEGDIALAINPAHQTALRIWRYRAAADLIRYAEDMKAMGQNGPGWAWVDCWQRGLKQDIGKAFVPLTQIDAHMLKKLNVKLCICSPELYVHEYEKTYAPEELENIYRGVVNYRRRLMQAGVSVDAVCTKFPWLWAMDVDLLASARSLKA